MFINLVLYLRILINIFKTASITFLSNILFELLDVEHGSPISHKNVKCNSLGLALAIDPLTQGKFCTLQLPNTTLLSHKMKCVSPLRVAALAFNIMLRTLPAK